MRLRQILKMLTQHVIYPFIYFINRWKKVEKNLIMLADAHHDTCPPHMQEIRNKLIEENYQVREFYRDVNKLGTLKGFISLAGFMSIYPKCGTVIICDNFLPIASCKKKKATTVIQLWHGCGAFKKFGYDASDDIPEGYKGNVYKNYDLVTVSGKACVPFFESAMRLEKVIKALGVSHTDRLFDTEYISKCRESFSRLYPEAAGKKVVLWAPTFRGNAHDGKLVGEDVIDSISKYEVFSDYYFVKSIHPHLIANEEKKVNAEAMNTEQLIVCADVLVTDYSSVFFEGLLTNIPIVFFAPDYDDYAKTRGFYIEYSNLPGQIVKNKDELISALQEKDSANFGDLREEFLNKYMLGCDGKATERVMEFIRRRM